MSPKRTLLTTSADPASLQMHRALLALAPWNRKEADVWELDRLRLVHLDGRLWSCDGIDRTLASRGLEASEILFCSRHTAESGRPQFCAHFTGNPGEAKFGGRPRELAVAAPLLLYDMLHALRRVCPEGSGVAMECTHHGPTDLHVPSLFVEVGSTEAEWNDPARAQLVARVLLDLPAEPRARRVLVGFGGGHYVPRQNRMLFEMGVAFGHTFPNYAIEGMDGERVREALEKSGTREAMLDKKSLKSAERERIREWVEAAGGRLVRESDLEGPPES